MFGSRRLIVKVSIFYILTVLLILFGWTLGGLHLITSNIINDKKDTLYNCARQIAVEFAEYDSYNVKEPDLTSRFNTVINYLPVQFKCIELKRQVFLWNMIELDKEFVISEKQKGLHKKNWQN